MASNHFWCKLPSLIVVEVFSYISKKDLINASSVCKQWRKCLFQPRLWRSVHFHVTDDDVSHVSNDRCEELAKAIGHYAHKILISVDSAVPINIFNTWKILKICAYQKNLQQLILRPKSFYFNWDSSIGRLFSSSVILER